MKSLAVAVLSLITLAAPLAAGAQKPGKPARLGVLAGGGGPPVWAPDSYGDHRAIEAGLRDQGLVVSEHVVIVGIRTGSSRPSRA